MPVPANISQECEDLTQLMGTGCWPILLDQADSQFNLRYALLFRELAVSPDLVRDILTQTHQSKKPLAISTSQGSTVFAIQMVSSPEPGWFTIGSFHDMPVPFVERLANTAAEASRRKQQIESQDQALLHAEFELSRSYTERQWLRQLNAQRIIRKRGSQPSRQAIESLRGIIDAEAVAICLYQDCDDEQHGLESMITGKPNWSVDDVRTLLQRIPKPDLGETIALNSAEFTFPIAQVRSCIVVPVGDTEPIGYVVALNRRRHFDSNSQINHNEFTSRDGELLHEVAGYLMADGYSNVSFQESEQLVLGMLRTMSNAIEARDPYTHGHSDRVGRVAYEIAVRLQLSEMACQEIYLSGILHDIGKIGIPDHVLLKAGKLEPDEFKIIQQHPEIGHKILVELGKLKFALPGVLYHHERIDGTGYPHGLKGDEIPLMARIIAVSDAYDAMTSSRIYRNAMGHQRAIEILQEGAGTQWDEAAVAACISFATEKELVLSDGSVQTNSGLNRSDWLQVSQALRVLQL